MEKILIIDFGGQYNQLIARKVREQHVYAEILPFQKADAETIKDGGYLGVILTGGPESVYEEASPKCGPEILNAGVPVLGICYGFQLMAYLAGGTVVKAAEESEYGKTGLSADAGGLLEGFPESSIVWMSHSDRVSELPEGFHVTAHTAKCPIAAFADEGRRLYGVQFHPEVTHTEYGVLLLKNFVFGICKCTGDWKMEDFLETSIRKYREELAGKKVLLALSGGVDSAVAGVLLHRAIGRNLKCVFVDHGLLRKGEGDRVEQVFGENFGMNLVRLNVKERFLSKLAGVTEPEQKRKIIGSEFIRVFEEEAVKDGDTDILAQGTIYPDVIESGKGASAVIKSHHNVGGLPKDMLFTGIVEPLRDLFKDEVRELGEKLGIPEELVRRQPFPGPGLAVRIIGGITEEKLSVLQDADAIFREEVDREIKRIREENNDPVPRMKPDQYFAVLTGLHTVGVMGDARTYGEVIALRAVSTDDFMTAEWTRLPFEVLERASGRITNEVRGVSKVVYDITSKPPSTVEWE